MWYHVSSDPETTDITEVFAPPENLSHGESRERRFSVAPTVCQAILARPAREDEEGEPIRDEVLNIQQVHVDNPVEPPPDSGIRDLHVSGERWITESVLENAGGRISRTLIGTVHVSTNLKITIRVWIHKLGTGMTCEQEDRLWDKSEHIWMPRSFNSVQMDAIVAGKPFPQTSGKPVRIGKPMIFLSEHDLSDAPDGDDVA